MDYAAPALSGIALNTDSVGRYLQPFVKTNQIGFEPKRQERVNASTMVEIYSRRGIDPFRLGNHPKAANGNHLKGSSALLVDVVSSQRSMFRV